MNPDEQTGQPPWNPSDKAGSLLCWAEWLHDEARRLFSEDGTHGQMLFLFNDEGIASVNPIPPETSPEQVEGGYILNWVDRGRDDARAGDNAYSARVMQGTNTLADVDYAELPKGEWTERSLVFACEDDSTAMTVQFIPDDNNNFGVLIDAVELNILKVELTARRPCTEGPEFNNPFAERTVPEDKEESPGAGIRVNGDTESAADEDDLIKVELKVEPFPVPSGVTYVLKRSNSSIKVWDSRTMGTAILDSGTEATITFSAATKTVWVENPSGGDADLELIARSSSTDICSDKIHFYDFTGIVVVFGGKDQVPNDPPGSHEDMFMVATNLCGLGYDVHMYFANDDQDAAFDEIVAAIQHRQVNNVAIFGYSWGGDETQEVAYRLDTGRAQIGTFSIRYTAYVDAVEELSGPQENLPLGSACHDNYYQSNQYPHGVFIQGSRINVNVVTLDPAVTHYHDENDPPPDHSIDNNATVRVNIASQLMSQMDP